MADLIQINEALQQYRATNGSFPVSDGFQGYASNWGATLGERWIPELADVAGLPRDPAQGEAGGEPQYLYFSDGTDYKLIAHATADCGPDVETQGILIDPVRRTETECWAYGFWSPGGATF